MSATDAVSALSTTIGDATTALPESTAWVNVYALAAAIVTVWLTVALIHYRPRRSERPASQDDHARTLLTDLAMKMPNAAWTTLTPEQREQVADIADSVLATRYPRTNPTPRLNRWWNTTPASTGTQYHPPTPAPAPTRIASRDLNDPRMPRPPAPTRAPAPTPTQHDTRGPSNNWFWNNGA